MTSITQKKKTKSAVAAPPPGATMATNAAPGTPTSAPAGRASMETGKRNMGLHCTSMRISRDETRSP
uniref:Uncharacterized protein n=1 Tax=Oryza rufipogon TaxID=4529 RepID=A0A0E0PX94_ORYRU